ncbi:MAG: esterase/lipase family protein [Thermoleophilaceae bacterium]
MGLEAASLMRDPVYWGEGVEYGHDQPVFLIPGFFAGDGSLAVLTHWLRRSGHRTNKAGMRINVGCSGKGVECLEERLEQLVEKTGKRAVVIGQSRGGSFAKVLACRRPDLVTGIITLGTPTLGSLAVHPLVRLQVAAVGALGSLGTPGLFTRACLNGECCSDFWLKHDGPLPDGVGFVSVYSRTDGIVDWHACLDPSAERYVEVNATHVGMGLNADVYRAIAEALTDFRHRGERARPAATVTQIRRDAAA